MFWLWCGSRRYLRHVDAAGGPAIGATGSRPVGNDLECSVIPAALEEMREIGLRATTPARRGRVEEDKPWLRYSVTAISLMLPTRRRFRFSLHRLQTS